MKALDLVSALADLGEARLRRLRKAGGGTWSPEKRIHEFRIGLKGQRALWRLLSPAIPPAVFRRENARLRAAGRKLSAGRNETVALKTLEKIESRVPTDSERKAVAAILKALRGKSRRSGDIPEALRALPEAQTALEETLRRFRAVSTAGKGRVPLERGLAKAYRKARRASGIGTDPEGGRFHYWRRRAKDLWYQLAALRALDRALELKKTLSRLDRLQELLGEEHDAVMVRSMLRASGLRPKEAGSEGTVLGLLDQDINRRRAKALKLGKKIFAENPRDFIRGLKNSV